MKKGYLKIGEKKLVGSGLMFKPDYYDDGLAYGRIFKDREAYEKDWDAICYVHETAFDGTVIDSDGFCEASGITHNEILGMCRGNREWCDYMFEKFIWACPETYLHELDDADIAYFYRFIKPGAKVWWNDPAGETSGVYAVLRTPFGFDEIGESDSFSLDAIVLIGNEHCEAEVSPDELTPIYPDLIKK